MTNIGRPKGHAPAVSVSYSPEIRYVHKNAGRKNGRIAGAKHVCPYRPSELASGGDILISAVFPAYGIGLDNSGRLSVFAVAPEL